MSKPIKTFKGTDKNEGCEMFYEFSGMGKYHINTMGENQDVVYHNRQDDCFVIALADGTSACKAAKRGAEIASKTLSGLLLRERKTLFEPDGELSAGLVVSTILNADHEIDVRFPISETE